MAALTKKLGFTGMADKRLAKLEAAYGNTAQKLQKSGLTATVGNISKARGEVRSNLVEAKERDAQLNKSHYKGKSGEMSAAKERLNMAQIDFKEDLRGAENTQKDANSAQLDVVREQNKAVEASRKFDHNTQIVTRLEAQQKGKTLNKSDQQALSEAKRRVDKYNKEEPKEKPKAPPLPTGLENVDMMEVEQEEVPGAEVFQFTKLKEHFEKNPPFGKGSNIEVEDVKDVKGVTPPDKTSRDIAKERENDTSLAIE
jgi:hypothetical protein